eukprot:2467984-Pyramimonas_sp.AAC.1
MIDPRTRKGVENCEAWKVAPGGKPTKGEPWAPALSGKNHPKSRPQTLTGSVEGVNGRAHSKAELAI